MILHHLILILILVFKITTLMEQKFVFHDSTKDLGLILLNNLDWTDHYHITAKAYEVLGLLRCSFKTESIDAKRKLYISLVRSQLLYCSQI